MISGSTPTSFWREKGYLRGQQFHAGALCSPGLRKASGMWIQRLKTQLDWLEIQAWTPQRRVFFAFQKHPDWGLLLGHS